MAKTVGFLLCLTHACLAGGATSPTSAPASAPADVVAREFLSQSLGNNGVLKRRALKELYLDVVSRGLKVFECNPTRRRWEDILESLQLRFQELSQVADQLTESQRRGYIGWG